MRYPLGILRLSVWCCACACAFSGSFLFAAAPTLKFLYPAGMQRGAKTQVTCHGEFDWPVRVWAPGADVEVEDEKGKLQVHIPKDFASDRIWIRLYNNEGTSQAIPFLIGGLPETQEVEPNDAADSPQVLSDFAPPPRDSEVTVNGVLQKNDDVDAFAVELTQGQTLVAAVEANTAFGSPIDAILQVVGPDDALVAENHDDKGLDPRLAITAADSGIYVVRLFAFPSQPNQSIRFHGGKDYVYRLTLTTGPYITSTIPTSVTRIGSDLVPSTVEVLGWNIPEGTRLPVSLIHEGTDDRVEMDASGMSYDLSTQVGLVRAPNWSGAARLRITSATAVESLVATSEQKPLAIQLPVSLTGRIAERRAIDYFRVDLKKDQPFQISVDALRLHSPLAPELKLFSPDGKVAAEISSKGAASDVTLSHTAKHDGEYRISLRDRFRHGGPRYTYRLSARTPEANYRLSLDADNLVVEASKPVAEATKQETGEEAPVESEESEDGGESEESKGDDSKQVVELVVNVHRVAGAGKSIGEIEVTAVGLPTGVSVERVVSKVKGDTAKKVALRFEADADVGEFVGRIRIQGTAVGSDQVRWALTPERYQASFDHLWLTVKPNAPDGGKR